MFNLDKDRIDFVIRLMTLLKFLPAIPAKGCRAIKIRNLKNIFRTILLDLE